MVGNPPDAPLLAPAVSRITALVGKALRRVTADRSYGEAGIDAELEALGVRAAIPARKALGGPAPGRAHPGIPQPDQVADGMRGSRQLPQARRGLEPHPAGRPRRGAPQT